RGLIALGEGRPVRPVATTVGGSLGRLARIFNEVAPELEARIARLEGDRQQLRAVLGGMAEGVIAVDARRRLVFANDAAGRLFDLDARAVGRMVAELIRSPEVQEAVSATLAGPGPHRAEINVQGWPRGGPKILAVQGTPLPGSPPPGAVLVFHDVTEMRRLERVRQDFVANASHELKTPLAAIKAYAETLLDGALHDDTVNVHFLRQIDEQADRLHQLVLDLLSLARLESGQETFQHAPLRLAPAVLRLGEAQRARAEAKDLDYRLAVDPTGEEVVVVADEEAIRQILDNLIDNAIKYTPEGGRILVTLRAKAQEAILEVADTGIGIPRDEQPRIFERFYRVDRARSRALGGTGLGLSIVKHLAQSLGGSVGVESRVGAGSTFTVRLPRHQAPTA
ncbi:MAG: PAS-domain containing protein, partial [Isosphaeraceae bacterium]|nr:PAS-domain containing protein [Isosphaeraceae bacterium]